MVLITSPEYDKFIENFDMNSLPIIVDEFGNKYCKVGGCKNKYYAKGYCKKHYDQFKKYGKIPERISSTPNDYIIQKGVFIGKETKPSDIVRMNCYNIKNEKTCDFIFDLEDLDKVKKHKWCLDSVGYIRSVINRKHIHLHNFLFEPMKCEKGFKRDHININPLDNRKCNLRLISDSLSSANRNICKNNKCGFKGVTHRKYKKSIKYRATITINNKFIHLGFYDTPEEAYEVYVNKCRELFGEYYLDNI